MTSTTKRRFTDEFKREAVALWETSGRMQTEVAAELGIMPTMLRRWQRKLQDSNDMLVSPAAKPPVSAIGSPADQASEIARLRRELDRARALLQTWGTAARRHPVGGLGSIGEMLIEHNHGFGQGRGSNSECSFNQAHLPHDTWLQAPCLGLSFA